MRGEFSMPGQDWRRTHIQTLRILIPIAGLLLLGVGAATFLLLRRFFTTGSWENATSAALELCWRDYRPLNRLLDPADFDYMRRQGVSEAKVKKLIAERRKIYRLCLRSLARDFYHVHRCVNLILIQSHIDRPDLA